MRIDFAHIREQAAAGGWIDFAVFDARSTSGSRDANAALLASLAARARAAGLKVDQAALAFSEGGQIRFFGTEPLVQYLSRSGLPRWTHSLEV
jgi:hypothetical protein